MPTPIGSVRQTLIPETTSAILAAELFPIPAKAGHGEEHAATTNRRPNDTASVEGPDPGPPRVSSDSACARSNCGIVPRPVPSVRIPGTEPTLSLPQRQNRHPSGLGSDSAKVGIRPTRITESDYANGSFLARWRHGVALQNPCRQNDTAVMRCVEGRRRFISRPGKPGRSAAAAPPPSEFSHSTLTSSMWKRENPSRQICAHAAHAQVSRS